jgi:cell shape-determining protein MreC
MWRDSPMSGDDPFVPKSISFALHHIQFLKSVPNASELIRSLLEDYINRIEGFSGKLEELKKLHAQKVKELEELEKQIDEFELKRKETLAEQEKERRERLRRLRDESEVL